MIRFLRSSAAAAALALCACGQAPAPAPARPASSAALPGDRLASLVEQYWDDYQKLNPQLGPQGAALRDDPGMRADISAQSLADSLALERRYLDLALALPRPELGSEARLTLDIFVRERELAVESFTYPSELMPVNPFRCVPLQFARSEGLAGAPASAKAYQSWRARSEQYVRWTAEAIANMRDGLRRGYTLPRRLVSELLPMLATLGSDTPANPFYRVRAAETGDGRPVSGDVAARIRDKILPAYRELHDFLHDEYLPRARQGGGLSGLPLGASWYAYLIKRETGSQLTAAALNAQGLADLEHLHGRMQALLSEAGFAGDAQAFLEAMSHGPHALAAPDELLHYYAELKTEAVPALAASFEETPQADFTMLPVEAYRQGRASDLSYRRARDPAMPAVVWVDTGALPAAPSPAAFLRAALPGQHFQLAIQTARTDLPRFRRFGGDPGFVDGWGMYAASLGDELGLNRDAESKFSALALRMRCVAGLVTDTGLNALGWSADQAFEFLRAQLPIEEAAAHTMVDRELALPGEALACAVGARTIDNLRTRAQQALGSRFDLRTFHAQILDRGAMPLDILDTRVDLWLNGAH